MTHIRILRPAAAAILALLGLVAAAAPATASSAPAQAAAPAVRFCGLTWGSTGVEFGPQIQGHILAARARQTSCTDLLALDLGSRTPDPGLHARYTAHCIQDASGQIKPMRGRAILTLTIFAPGGRFFPANEPNLIRTRNPDGSFRFIDFRQIRTAGNFEGISTVCIGLRFRLPFSVQVIHPAVNDGKSTVRIRFAHFWNEQARR